MGVKRVSVPNRATKSRQRKQEQKTRWFKQAQKWRTGCEGRISLLKRRHGLTRCRYKGDAGMQRWVGLGSSAITASTSAPRWRERPVRSRSLTPHSMRRPCSIQGLALVLGRGDFYAGK
jgi:hypothetical protein